MNSIAEHLDDACLLNQNSGHSELAAVCSLAVTHGIYGIVTPLYHVPAASELLAGSEVNLASVISFPYGFDDIHSKVTAITSAIRAGAEAIDFVVNISALFDKDLEYLEEEMHAIGELSVISKAIIELSLLSPAQVKLVCEIIEDSNIDCVKTCTGKLSNSLKLSFKDKLKRIELIKKHAPSKLVKFSGGVDTLEKAKTVVEAGVDLIGTSKSFSIVKEEQQDNQETTEN